MPRDQKMVKVITDPGSLPLAVEAHLKLRMDQRKINPPDVRAYRYWLTTRPHAPEATDWYKDFGTFILVGNGAMPKSVLEPGMRPKGVKLAVRIGVLRAKLLQRP